MQKLRVKSDQKVAPQGKTANDSPSESNAALSGTQVVGPEKMKQMLQNTRDSLNELRSLVHGGSARSQRGDRANGTIVTKEKSATLEHVTVSQSAKKNGTSDSVTATEHAETL